QGQLLLDELRLGALVVLYSVWQAFSAALFIAFLTSVVTRVVRRRWLALLFAATLVTVVAAVAPWNMGAVQPYPWKVILLLFDCLILAWAFTGFDLLTLAAAAFTIAFFGQNYALLVMFKPTGSMEAWIAFAVWGLFVAAAASVAFKSSILAAYRRVA